MNGTGSYLLVSKGDNRKKISSFQIKWCEENSIILSFWEITKISSFLKTNNFFKRKYVLQTKVTGERKVFDQGSRLFLKNQMPLYHRKN